MYGGVLQIGSFIFEIDDLPEKIPLGGEQVLAVQRFPGGKKEVQSFGNQDKNPQWSGTFNYNALDKLRVLYKLYTDGKVVPISVGSLDLRYGIIKVFTFDYANDTKIDYQIEIELVGAPAGISIVSAPLTSATGIATPEQNKASANKSYITKRGDTLWQIAATYYNGDGSQYRKIATANGIKDPDNLAVGLKLVIPS